jgi:hypothetical protein
LRAYLHFAIQYPDSYRVIYNEAQPDSAEYNELQAEIFRSAESMRQVVNCSVENGTIIGEPVNICYGQDYMV